MGGAEIEQKENPGVTGAQIKNLNLKSRRAVAIILSARRVNVSLNGALSGVIRGLYLTCRRVILLGDRLTTDQFGVVRDWEWPTGQITLHLVAAFLHEERMLGFGLDPFRQDRLIKASAETDDCVHDSPGVVVVFQVANKDTIDLDLVEPERLQIRQGRKSGSEIIHCNLYAQRLEPIEDRYRAREVVNHYALGDFEFEAARSKASFEEDRMDEPRQVTMAELDRRDIDRNG